MTPVEWAALAAAYSLLEYWLGKTNKVKAGSAVELVLNLGKTVIGAVKPPEKPKDPPPPAA